jgi:site-specific recombinase XerD
MLPDMKKSYPSITRFEQHVELKDYRPPTKDEYVRNIRRLANHFNCDPARLSEDRIRQYFLFLRQDRRSGNSTMKMVKYALRSFFVEHLKIKKWSVFDDLRISEPLVLPVVLSRAEVQTVLNAVKEPRFRVCLRLMYYCGLRVSEAVGLQIKDIHGRENPPRLHIRDGKGGKDRYVPIAPAMVEELRQWWRVHRNPKFLFPTPGMGKGAGQRPLVLIEAMKRSLDSMREHSVQIAYRLAQEASGVNPDSTPHTLRHSYATHLLEEGVSLLQISRYLGLDSLNTTVIYTHLTAVSEMRTQTALKNLHQPLKP